MDTVLLISEKNNFMVLSLKEQLKERNINVLHTDDEPSEIGKIKENIRLLLLWSENISMEGLVYLRDRVIEESIPVYVLGDREQVKKIADVIPNQFIKKCFYRPVDIKEVVENTDKFMREDDSHLKKKILVVDDSGTMLRSIKGWLEDKYQVILANSGAMAIKYLAMSSPDLILLDYEMPICDGKQVLEMIRAETEFSNIPVIFLTNKNDRESVMGVSVLKPEGYLLKTMEPGQIVQAIDEFFEKRKDKLLVMFDKV